MTRRVRSKGAAWRRWHLLGVGSVVLWSGHAGAQARDVEGAKRWQLGEPAPVGYRVARKHTLGIVGGSLLGGGYAFSGLMGFALTTECYVPGAEGRSGSRPCSGEPLYRAAPLLFIPVAGPFVALTKDEVQRDGGAVFWFSVFGAVQVTGAALLAYDLAVPHYGLRRGEGDRTTSTVGPRFWVAPAYLDQGPGVVVLGQL